MKPFHPSDRQLQALARAKRLALSVEGITGVDFGCAYRDHSRTRRRCIRFHVRRKRQPSQLNDAELLPRELLGVPCDVIEAAYEPHAASPRGVHDPIRPGISIGNVQRRSTGTLGMFVSIPPDGQKAVLSNWHVLCGSADCAPGEEISQPGPHHLGMHPSRPIAVLHRWLDLSLGYDAAIAALTDEVTASPEILGIGGVEARGAAAPEVGMKVVKAGTESGLTHAVIDGVEGSFPMNYERFGDQLRWMDGMRLMPDPDYGEDEISLRGDSGAVWIEAATGKAIGLHMGGEDGLGPLAEFAIAQPMIRVLDALDVSLEVPGAAEAMQPSPQE